MDNDKQVIFDAVIDQIAGWQDLVNAHWDCLNFDDKRRILVLASGGGGAGDFASLTGDPSDNAALAAALAGAGGALPSWNDQEVATLAAVAQGDPITATGLTATPTGRVDVYSPGGQHWLVGDGVKTKDIYFSADAGVTARARVAIVAGDIPYLGTMGVAAGGVPAAEKISMCYTL